MESIAKSFVLALLALALAALVTTIQASEAHAQDMSAGEAVERFESACFTEQGEFEPTDGCYKWAEDIGLEVDNIIECMSKGCVLSNMFEDYSCKGPEYQGYDYVGEQVSSSEEPAPSTVSEEGCVSVDMADPEVSGQDIDVLLALGFDVPVDNDDKLYSPECFEEGVVEPAGTPLNATQQRIADEISEQGWPTPQDAAQAENLEESKAKGCTPENLFEDLSCKGPGYKGYTPITQQGTAAPSDWRSHVVPLKPAASSKLATTTNKVFGTVRPTTRASSETTPYVEKDPNDNGRSQGKVVSSEQREKAHAAAAKVEAKMKASKATKKK